MHWTDTILLPKFADFLKIVIIAILGAKLLLYTIKGNINWNEFSGGQFVNRYQELQNLVCSLTYITM